MADNSLTVKPTIKDGHIITVEVGFENLPLKKPIPLEAFNDFMSKLAAIAEYIDFEGESGWNFDEIWMFLLNDISDKALNFFKVLVNKDWIERDDILKEMQVTGRELAGILSSPGQYFSKHKKDSLYEKNEKDDGRTYYRIKPKYMEDVKRALQEEMG